ncbi:hypothetical protein GN956_G3441 [Arapaima gigas]
MGDRLRKSSINYPRGAKYAKLTRELPPSADSAVEIRQSHRNSCKSALDSPLSSHASDSSGTVVRGDIATEASSSKAEPSGQYGQRSPLEDLPLPLSLNAAPLTTLPLTPNHRITRIQKSWRCATRPRFRPAPALSALRTSAGIRS